MTILHTRWFCAWDTEHQFWGSLITIGLFSLFQCQLPRRSLDCEDLQCNFPWHQNKIVPSGQELKTTLRIAWQNIHASYRILMFGSNSSIVPVTNACSLVHSSLMINSASWNNFKLYLIYCCAVYLLLSFLVPSATFFSRSYQGEMKKSGELLSMLKDTECHRGPL